MTEAFNLPDFSGLQISEIVPDLQHILDTNRQKITQLISVDKPDWKNFVFPLDILSDKLERYWSPVRHLNSVMNDPELREAYNTGLKLISEYSTELSQNVGLYCQFELIQESENFANLAPGQQKAIEDNLRSFRLGGVSLAEDDKQRFQEISLRLSELGSRFSENVLDSANAWQKHILDRSLLSGLPEFALQAAAERASEKGKEGWLFNLEFPTYHAIQTFAENRELREEFYIAWSTRASQEGPHASEFDNAKLIEEILALRKEKATLLGFSEFADLSVESKMVESSQQVLEFLQELIEKSRPPAMAEFSELEDFASEIAPQTKIQAWDVSYFSNKLKEKKYKISEEDLKPYFPADRVIPGLFEIVRRLFGLEITKLANVDVWHKDVDFYRIEGADGEQRGGFFLDTYARENKRGGAWMDECVTRMQLEDGIQFPVAYLTCNLTPPVGDEPALLTHNEVITLFHEFGHGLHHMLTQVDYRDVSGINGVEWDAVELPSQFLENWCWEREALDLISGHYRSGEKIPPQLLDKAYKARNFQSAMMMVRQLEFALFDMQIHLAGSTPDVQAILDQVRSIVSVVPVPSINRFQNSFTHIFAGGYAAGYFSYKWAEVLSADAFSRFEEEGIFNHKTAGEFLHAILERGGTQKALELFREFRGRDPEIEALLRHSGLAA